MLDGNLNQTLSSKLQLNANVLGGRNTTNKITDSWQQNYLSTGSTTETGKSTERSDKDSYGANIRMEWKPDSLTEIIISPRAPLRSQSRHLHLHDEDPRGCYEHADQLERPHAEHPTEEYQRDTTPRW